MALVNGTIPLPNLATTGTDGYNYRTIDLINNNFDYNRDRFVNGTDQILAVDKQWHASIIAHLARRGPGNDHSEVALDTPVTACYYACTCQRNMR